MTDKQIAVLSAAVKLGPVTRRKLQEASNVSHETINLIARKGWLSSTRRGRGATTSITTKGMDALEEQRNLLGETKSDGTAPLPVLAMLRDRDFRAVLVECDRLLSRKGHDYTQGREGDEGRLSNFYRSAQRTGVSPFQVLSVYLGKHLDAIDTFIKKGQVESEPIEGRICDAINYLLLLYKLVQHEKRRAK